MDSSLFLPEITQRLAQNIASVIVGKNEVIEKVTSYAASIGFDILEIEFSPIKGPEGNIEYLVHLKKTQELPGKILAQNLETVVDSAFDTLAK